MYGGGGITPDEKIPSEKLNIFQRRMGPQEGPNWFYRFANNYFGGAKPSLQLGWQADDAVVERFLKFLNEHKRNVTFTDEEFAENKKWIAGQIRWEFYFRAFDRAAAERAKWTDDPQVLKAIESLPKAQNLLSQAQKVFAMRQ
jgi:carboxyl-terminal processing protease